MSTNPPWMPARLLLLALLAFGAGPLAGAQTGNVTLSGSVRDSTTGEDLIGATVMIVETRQGAITNAYGFYSITMAPGTYTVRVQMEGYMPITQTIAMTENRSIRFDMPTLAVEAVQIDATADVIAQTDMGRESMTMETVRSIPMLFGETDLIRAIQLLPGVQAAGDGNTGFNVRGGGIDQNLILLDEATVYNPSHLLGFFSVFNSDAVKGADLYKGGIPARYGGRLSSVLDVRMNDGNQKRFSGTGGIGTIASRLTLSGPIVRDRGAFIVSGRRTYADLFLLASSDPQVRENRLYFYDGNFKANYQINDNNRIFLSGYIGRDVFGFSNLFRFTWGNATATARWNHIFNQKLFLNTTFIFSNFDYNFQFELGAGQSIRLVSGLQNYSLKSDFSYYPANGHTITFGAQSTYMRIRPGTIRGAGEDNFVNDLELERRFGQESAVYWDHDMKLGSRFSLRYGLRLSHFANLGPTREFRYRAYPHDPSITDTVRYDDFQVVRQFFGWEPRIGANFRLNERQAIKASLDRTVQFVHQLVNSATSLPSDLWYPSGTYINPQNAIQAAVGYFHVFGRDNMFEFSVETYYKWLNNQLDYRDFARLQFNDKLELEVLSGKGRAYGVELMLRKNVGKLSGWVSYTYSRTLRTFAGINNGNEFRSIYDRPHFATVVASWRPNQRWQFGGTFLYSSGQPLTFPIGSYLTTNGIVPLYGERNNYRMPDYIRMDLSATFHFKKKNPESRFSHSLNFSVYNALNRKNAWAIFIADNQEDEEFNLRASKIYLFPILPSVTWNFEF